MATRERQLQFIRSFGISALEDAVARMLVIEGPSFLTDEQLDQATSLVVRTERARQQRRVRNRAEGRVL